MSYRHAVSIYSVSFVAIGRSLCMHLVLLFFTNIRSAIYTQLRQLYLAAVPRNVSLAEGTGCGAPGMVDLIEPWSNIPNDQKLLKSFGSIGSINPYGATIP